MPIRKPTARLSLSGRASLVPAEVEGSLRRRWLAAHPYAEGYASFTDFALWRFMPERAHFVGGFAQAHRLSLDALYPPPEAVTALAAAEEALLEACDGRQAEDDGDRGRWRRRRLASWRPSIRTVATWRQRLFRFACPSP